MELRIQRCILDVSLWFQLRALVSFSPTPPKDFSLTAVPWRDCSLQLPLAELKCFTAAASGLTAREDEEMKSWASLNLCAAEEAEVFPLCPAQLSCCTTWSCTIPKVLHHSNSPAPFLWSCPMPRMCPGSLPRDPGWLSSSWGPAQCWMLTFTAHSN